MIEIIEDIWFFENKPKHVICITTNLAVRKDGAAVMGRGVALQAKQRYPGIEFSLGYLLNSGFTYVGSIWQTPPIWSFPVKFHWKSRASYGLIEKSAKELSLVAESMPQHIFILPRPGCGNGGLIWRNVKPYCEILPDNVWIVNNE